MVPDRVKPVQADYDELSKLIKQATNVPLGTQIMILGDFNYPDIDYKKEEHGIGHGTGLEASENLQITSECGLHQHVHDYTRYRADQNPSILDYILTDDE